MNKRPLVVVYIAYGVASGTNHERILCFDVRGSMHHSIIHKEKSNKMQQCIKILLFHIYVKLNMFLATNRPSSGA